MWWVGKKVKPCVEKPINIRGRELGGPKPLFCIPLVADEPTELVAQAKMTRRMQPDLFEWRADFSKDWTPAGLVFTGKMLRRVLPDEPIIFTLRNKAEGGAQEIPQCERRTSIEAVLRSNIVDIVDLELANEPEFLKTLMGVARKEGIQVIESFHDFQGTPQNKVLLAKIAAMHANGAEIAKIAVMAKAQGDVLRLLQVTFEARGTFPGLPLAIMSLGTLGSITRVAGFMFGSDMAYSVGGEASAPGQIPIEDHRLMTETLLRFLKYG
jgi:3-dehydroquinate dehydratase I